MMVIRGARASAAAPGPQDDVPVTDPLGERAAVGSQLNRQLIVFPRYELSVPGCMPASCAHSGCASTLPQPPRRIAETSRRNERSGRPP